MECEKNGMDVKVSSFNKEANSYSDKAEEEVDETGYSEAGPSEKGRGRTHRCSSNRPIPR